MRRDVGRVESEVERGTHPQVALQRAAAISLHHYHHCQYVCMYDDTMLNPIDLYFDNLKILQKDEVDFDDHDDHVHEHDDEGFDDHDDDSEL